MAKKRKSTEMEPKASPASTMTSTESQALIQDLDEFCRKASINIPPSAIESPANLDKYNIKTQARNLYGFLWWRNRRALNEAKLDFFRTLESGPHGTCDTEVKRIQLILEKLRRPAAETPNKAVKHMPGIYEQDSTQAMPASPKSPLLSRSVTNLSKLVGGVPGPSTPEVSRLPFPKPTKSATDLRAAFPTVKQSSPLPANANISFKSTTTATTSFSKSFASSQGFPGTQETAATSFSDDMPSQKRESDQYSSMTPSMVQEMTALERRVIESTQNSNSTSQTVRPFSTSIPPCESVRESEFGSSIGPSVADELQARMDSYYDSFYTTSAGRDVSMTDLPPSPTQPNYRTVSPKRTRLNSRRRQFAAGPDAHVERQSPSQPDVFQLQLSEALQRLPFELQWDAQLILQSGKLSAAELEAAWTVPTREGLHKIAAQAGLKLPVSPDPDSLKSYETLTRNAKLQWAKSSAGSSLDLILQAPRKDTSCALQRRLGSDRVLYIEVPDLEKPPDLFKGRNTSAQFQRWMDQPHHFLGREWFLFFLQPNKKKEAFSDRSTGVSATDKSAAGLYRLVLIAPEDDQTICDIMEWCLPYGTNSHQTARKAYMRLELQLSRTIVVAILKAHEIEVVPDQGPSYDSDDHRFDDPELQDDFEEHFTLDTVMNDGCNIMAYWIAYQYKQILGLETTPSTLQIRAAGAKGLWYIDSEHYGSLSKRPSGVLLKISASQMKVLRQTFENCDDETLSVCVVKANPPAKPSILHMGFLPILLDRGVPASVLRELVQTQVQGEIDEFLQALDAEDTLQIRRWMSSHNEYLEARNREAGIEMLAGFPQSAEEKVIQMYEAGFIHKKLFYLAREVVKMARNHFNLARNSLKIHLPQSTTLMGIADPKGVLEPGEVCIVFGRPFNDPSTGESFQFLDNVEGLVARNPALAPWDMQKVRFVFKPELAHLRDVIIFSTKGMRPLANKLQGGDYDGDTFWICFDKRLSDPFKNAPAPWEPPKPETLGIRKDSSRLSDHVQEPLSSGQWNKFLGNMAKKRMAANMLGGVTLFAERVAYTEGGIRGKKYQTLVHLHDYLVDSDKQGYDFSDADFSAFKREQKFAPNLPKPAYWRFSRNEQENEKKSTTYEPKTFPVKDNITDIVFFDIVEPIINAGLKKAAEMIEDTARYDYDLANLFNETMKKAKEDHESGKDSTLIHEMKSLKTKLEAVRKCWAEEAKQYSYEEYVMKMRRIYDDIQPDDPRSAKAEEWLRRTGSDLSLWDKLKASCFARTQNYSQEKPSALIFTVAGAELCYLKATMVPEARRTILQSQYQALKLRRAKRPPILNEFDEDAGEPDQALETAGYY